MTGAGTELARLLIAATSDDPMLATELAAALRPYLQPEPVPDVGWLDLRRAAVYIGMTPNALHKRTATREIIGYQAVPGGKWWFWRPDLDAYRRGRGSPAKPHAEAHASNLLPNVR